MTSIYKPECYQIDPSLSEGVIHTFAVCLSPEALADELTELKTSANITYPAKGYSVHTGHYTPQRLHTVICLPYEHYGALGRGKRRVVIKQIIAQFLNHYTGALNPDVVNLFIKGFADVMRDLHATAKGELWAV